MISAVCFLAVLLTSAKPLETTVARKQSGAWTVYALKDPRTGDVRYIGVTFSVRFSPASAQEGLQCRPHTFESVARRIGERRTDSRRAAFEKNGHPGRRMPQSAETRAKISTTR